MVFRRDRSPFLLSDDRDSIGEPRVWLRSQLRFRSRGCETAQELQLNAENIGEKKLKVDNRI